MKRKGFTLVEMLVVIGIILVLIGLLAPMTMRAWKAGDRASTLNSLHVIAAGLDAYRADHGAYPEVSPPPTGIDVNWNGARMLCRALLSPGPGVGPILSIPDGAGTLADPSKPESPSNQQTVPAPGFRLRGTQGRVFGPYLNTASFKTGNPANPSLPSQPGFWAILDRYGKPILYYPATGKTKDPAAYVGNFPPDAVRPLFNARDNAGAMTLPVLKKSLGDANGDGKFTAPETPAYFGDFLLWSSGPDETYGNADDITNFSN